MFLSGIKSVKTAWYVFKVVHRKLFILMEELKIKEDIEILIFQGMNCFIGKVYKKITSQRMKAYFKIFLN